MISLREFLARYGPEIACGAVVLVIVVLAWLPLRKVKATGERVSDSWKPRGRDGL